MKGLIYIDEKFLINNKFDLIENQMSLLKICGKPLVEYYFDFLYTIGVDEIFIVGNKFSDQISQIDFVKHSTIKVTSLFGNNLSDCYKMNADLFQKDQLLIIENIGFIFNKYIDKDSLKNNVRVSKDNFSLYFITEHSKDMQFNLIDKNDFLNVQPLENIDDYINITNEIFNNLSTYDSIPGYTKDNNIVIGKHVKIDSDCKLYGPLIILDNVKVCKGTTLGPHSIIGKDTFIQENSKIINSVIYDNTYIGENLNIDNKIVASSYLIDKSDIEIYRVDDMLLSKNSTWI